MVWLLLLLLSGTASGADDEVTKLPGWNGKLPSKHYSGYVQVSNSSNKRYYHYYLQEAEEDPENKPLVLWLNGGPGASSLFGAFAEMGQLVFTRNSMDKPGTVELIQNPYSWTKVANMLYLESPAGVGFSYCDYLLCVNTDSSTAEDNHEALVQFFQIHNEYKTRPFYLTGESYAGIYLPMLMERIEHYGVINNVKGIAIGNGCWGTSGGTNCGDLGNGPSMVYKSDAQLFYNRGLVSTALKKKTDDACGTWTDPLSPACLQAYTELSDAVGKFNLDNTDDFCFGEGAHTLLEHRERRRKAQVVSFAGILSHANLTAPFPAAPPNGDVQMWCGVDTALNIWTSDPDTASDMNVKVGHHSMRYEIEPQDLRPYYLHLATLPSIKFVIYNGLADANVPYLGQVDYWAQNLPVKTEWVPWYNPRNASDLEAGHVRTYGGNASRFQFVVITGAGHEVPEYRPLAALSMMEQFVLV